MGKAILIFSDGTGQSGGIRFDEERSNIYKLYRATRCGPDSSIDPQDQATFYDAGLGSPGAGAFIKIKLWRQIYNLVSSMTGLGITRNIVDCYAAIIRLYRQGDRIFLFGFSRGAYTVRSLAAVIGKCGIPRQMPDGTAVPLDVRGSYKLAATAVEDVYQFCQSMPRDPSKPYRDFMLDTRERIAARFRYRHKSFNPEDQTKCDPEQAKSFDPSDPGRANVYPYFIGAFDTVAAIGRPGAVALLTVAAALALTALAYVVSALSNFQNVRFWGWLRYFTFENLLVAFFAIAGIMMMRLVYRHYVKFDFQVPGYSWWQSLKTLHISPPKFKFSEYTLSKYVEYAKHAISIDENRKDFKRVRWNPDGTRKDKRDAAGNIHFEQVWFAGVHSDIGGGYQENEARLSDIALNWMLAAASMIPDGIKHDPTVLRLNPDALGPQHDEFKNGHWQFAIRDLPRDKNDHVVPVIAHKTVYERFSGGYVLQYDVEADYRPAAFREHPDFAHYYATPTSAPPATLVSVAADIERTWEDQKTAARTTEQQDV
jgi:hypothetical protein